MHAHSAEDASRCLPVKSFQHLPLSFACLGETVRAWEVKAKVSEQRRLALPSVARI